MNWSIKSDVGRVRTVNEDRAIVREFGGLTVALLADGMGGHQAGDIASQTAVDAVGRELGEVTAEMSDEEWEAAVKHAIERANSEIFAQASLHPQLSGMGTTIIAALAAPGRLLVASIGDSRAYLYRNGELEQLTEDHSLVNELLRSGQISAQEAAGHPRRNVLTRALGTEARVRADLLHWNWQSGDVLLLCSDGLSNMLGTQELIQTMQQSLSLEHKAEQLVAKALGAGGDDNITVVLVEHGKTEAEGRDSR